MLAYGAKRKRRYVYLEEFGSDRDWHKMKRCERQSAKREIRKGIAEMNEEMGYDEEAGYVNRRHAV